MPDIFGRPRSITAMSKGTSRPLYRPSSPSPAVSTAKPSRFRRAARVSRRGASSSTSSTRMSSPSTAGRGRGSVAGPFAGGTRGSGSLGLRTRLAVPDPVRAGIVAELASPGRQFRLAVETELLLAAALGARIGRYGPHLARIALHHPHPAFGRQHLEAVHLASAMLHRLGLQH